MQSYNYLSNELPRELIEIYNDLQNDILRIIVKRLKQGEKAEKVFQEIKDKVDAYKPKIDKVLLFIFADSKKKNVKDDKKQFKSEKTEEREPLTNIQANSIVIPEIMKATEILNGLNKKIVNNAMNRYAQESLNLKSPFGDGLSKLQKMYKNLANEGITIYESFGGGKSKNYSIENILKRDVMARVNQANAKVNMENFKKSSAKFIQVSSHPTARTWNKYMKHPYEDHSKWQGKVYYSRNGEVVDGYAEFESTCGYGEMLGICGINCYHQFQMNYTGDNTATKYSDEEVKKQYELSQKQRAFERAIRKLKQAKSVYEEAGETVLAKSIGQNIRTATSQLKEFCSKNGLKYYNWRTKI